LQTVLVRRRWSAAARGTNINNLKRGDFADTPVPLPPLDEQRRIVEILEDHLSRLDAGIDGLRKAELRAESLADATVHAWTSIRPHRSIPLGEMLADPMANGRSVKTRAGGFPVLRLTCLRDGAIDVSERKEGAWSVDDAAQFLVRRGDFLVSRGNGTLSLVGRGGLVEIDPDPVAYPDTLIRVRVDERTIIPEYLRLVWNGPETRQQIERAARTTAGIYKVNQASLGAILLPVPTLDAQRTIVAQCDGFTTRLQSGLTGIADERQRADSLRRSLLAAAFLGRLTGQGSETDMATDELARA
jgi:type I restriction enzyme S subunit